MGDGCRVAPVIKLTKKLAVRDLLGGVCCADAKQLAHEFGLAHVFEQESVIGDAGFDY